MSDFGDFDEADAFGTEPADPEQVARKFHEIERDLRLLDGQEPGPEFWEVEDVGLRDLRVAVVAIVLAWLHRQGSG